MNRLMMTVGLAAALALLTLGCDNHDHGAESGAAATGAHDDHGHAHAHGHDHGGEKTPLPELVEVGGYEITAVQNGKFAPGGAVNFDVEIRNGPQPKAVRFWIGTEAGRGGAKKPADEVRDTVYHVDLEVPGELPEGSRLWVEIDPPTGETVRGSFTPAS